MREKSANILAALLMLAASATAADIPAGTAVPEAPSEMPPEMIAPAPPQPAGEGASTFDTMESIPFENTVEPPDDPPALDNAVRMPGLDNAVPAPPGAQAPAAIPAAPPVPPAPPAAPPVPPVSLTAP